MRRDISDRGNVVYLKTSDARARRLRRVATSATGAVRVVVKQGRLLLALAIVVTLQILHLVLCTLLVLMEPFVRAILVSVAFLSFVVTVIFGVLIGDARFPTFGMLAFSVGALWLYWLFVGLMTLLMRLPRGQD